MRERNDSTLALPATSSQDVLTGLLRHSKKRVRTIYVRVVIVLPVFDPNALDFAAHGGQRRAMAPDRPSSAAIQILRPSASATLRHVAIVSSNCSKFIDW